jgi:hypothetical protein
MTPKAPPSWPAPLTAADLQALAPTRADLEALRVRESDIAALQSTGHLTGAGWFRRKRRGAKG